LELLPDHLRDRAGITFDLRFPHAYNRKETGAMSGLGFGADLPIRFAMQLTAFAVANNDRRGTRILEHFRRNVAREGPSRLRMTVLPADAHERFLGHCRKLANECRRRTNQEVCGGNLRRAGNYGRKLARRSAQPVHLPITRNEWSPS
jgi:hypothetical protein